MPYCYFFCFRGEKLYVTKDKRGEKSKSKCLCWGLCLCIVAAALIIGILAAGKWEFSNDAILLIAFVVQTFFNF